jgi:cytochrome c oxidase subunit 2
MHWLPPAAAEHAAAIDSMLGHVHWVMLALFAGWGAYFLYAVVRFRRGRQPRARAVGASGRVAMLAIAAVVIAEAVMLGAVGLPLWFDRTAPPAAGSPIVVRVVAEQFAWHVHYPGEDGRFGGTSPSLISDTNPLGLDRQSPGGRDDLVVPAALNVPVGRPVIVQLSSKDVLHSFGIPAMRVKQDVMPGLHASAWFTPTVEGEFEVVCSQLCGIGHHRMRAVVIVQSDAAFRAFLQQEKALQVR